MESLDAALHLRHSRSLQDRARCWQATLEVLDSIGSPTPGMADAVVDAVVGVVEMLQDSTSTAEWLRALSQFARRPDFGAEFARSLVSRLLLIGGSAAAHPLTPRAKMLAARALCRVLGANFGTAAGELDARSFSDLVVALGHMIHAVREDSRRPNLARSAQTAVRGLFMAVPESAARFAGVLFALEAPGVEATAIAAVLLDPALPKPVETSRDSWLGLYINAVVSSADLASYSVQLIQPMSYILYLTHALIHRAGELIAAAVHARSAVVRTAAGRDKRRRVDSQALAKHSQGAEEDPRRDCRVASDAALVSARRPQTRRLGRLPH